MVQHERRRCVPHGTPSFVLEEEGRVGTERPHEGPIVSDGNGYSETNVVGVLIQHKRRRGTPPANPLILEDEHLLPGRTSGSSARPGPHDGPLIGDGDADSEITLLRVLVENGCRNIWPSTIILSLEDVDLMVSEGRDDGPVVCESDATSKVGACGECACPVLEAQLRVT